MPNFMRLLSDRVGQYTANSNGGEKESEKRKEKSPSTKVLNFGAAPEEAIFLIRRAGVRDGELRVERVNLCDLSGGHRGGVS